jgi:hypothetical protein
MVIVAMIIKAHKRSHKLSAKFVRQKVGKLLPVRNPATASEGSAMIMEWNSVVTSVAFEFKADFCSANSRQFLDFNSSRKNGLCFDRQSMVYICIYMYYKSVHLHSGHGDSRLPNSRTVVQGRPSDMKQAMRNGFKVRVRYLLAPQLPGVQAI